MKPGCTLFFPSCSTLTVTTTTHAQTPDTATTTPYLLAGAPTFDPSISQLREDFNSQNLSLPLNEFCAIDSSPNKANLTRATNKINENLYTSVVLECDTLKIKNIQMTWLPIQGLEQKIMKAKAQEYMVAAIRTPTPLTTRTQSQEKLQPLLTVGKNKRYYIRTEGTLRYVVVGNGEKGLAFAVEPIKLALPEPLEGLNKRRKARPSCR